MEFIPIYKRPVTTRLPRPLRSLRDSYSRPEPLIHPCHERELLKQTAAGEPTQHCSRKAAMLRTKHAGNTHPASRCNYDRSSSIVSTLLTIEVSRTLRASNFETCHRSNRLVFFFFFCFFFVFVSIYAFTSSSVALEFEIVRHMVRSVTTSAALIV